MTTQRDTTQPAGGSPVERGVRRPRVRVLVREEDGAEATYKGHTINVSRGKLDRRWYIRVWAPNGCYAYDGWWQGSEDKTHEDALLEACRGAMLVQGA